MEIYCIKVFCWPTTSLFKKSNNLLHQGAREDQEQDGEEEGWIGNRMMMLQHRKYKEKTVFKNFARIVICSKLGCVDWTMRYPSNNSKQLQHTKEHPDTPKQPKEEIQAQKSYLTLPFLSFCCRPLYAHCAVRVTQLVSHFSVWVGGDTYRIEAPA